MYWYDYLSIIVNILALITFGYSIFSFWKTKKENEILNKESEDNKKEAKKINDDTKEALSLIIDKIAEIESITKENLRLSLETKLLLQDEITDRNTEILINDINLDEFIDSSNMYLDAFKNLQMTKNINSKKRLKKKK